MKLVASRPRLAIAAHGTAEALGIGGAGLVMENA